MSKLASALLCARLHLCPFVSVCVCERERERESKKALRESSLV